MTVQYLNNQLHSAMICSLLIFDMLIKGRAGGKNSVLYLWTDRDTFLIQKKIRCLSSSTIKQLQVNYAHSCTFVLYRPTVVYFCMT